MSADPPDTADARPPATPATASPESPGPPRPGASFFTIEGRAAPGLFIVGWLASILGLSIVVVGAAAGSALLAYFVGPGILSIGLIAGAGSQALERRSRGEAYAGPSPILVFGAMVAVSCFVGAIFGLVLEAVLDAAGLRVSEPVGELIAGLLTAAIFIGLVRLTVVGTGALTWREMGISRFNRAALADLLFGTSLALPVIGITLILGAILISIFRATPTSPLPPTGQASGLLIQLVAAAIVAPLAEEIVFRGFAITAWRRGIGPSRAILRAALLFAIAHVIGIHADSFPEAIGLFVVGMGTRLPVAYALGWLFVRRESIWAPIGLHATFNAALLILAHVTVTAATP
jgi:membrane protease YdiL (CAAX protease family)